MGGLPGQQRVQVGERQEAQPPAQLRDRQAGVAGQRGRAVPVRGADDGGDIRDGIGDRAGRGGLVAFRIGADRKTIKTLGLDLPPLLVARSSARQEPTLKEEW